VDNSKGLGGIMKAHIAQLKRESNKPIEKPNYTKEELDKIIDAFIDYLGKRQKEKNNVK
jgi:hypothetical protein